MRIMLTLVKNKYFLVYILAVLVTFFVIYNSVHIENGVLVGSLNDTPVKYILYYTTMFDRKDFYLGLGSELFENCTYKNCYATHDRTLVPLEEFSAVLFHGAQYSRSGQGAPRTRSPNQMYVFSNQESPLNSAIYSMRGTKEFYNWTMTYKQDSDIPRRYGYIIKKETNYTLPSIEETKRKQFRIAWFVSNCNTQSRRDKLAKEINKFIPVDIYGGCGSLKCPVGKSEECYKMLEDKYKFYFSAENTICKDYITEKTYNVLKKNVIPLVYGGADYDKLTPPKSVIDVTTFDTVEELVGHLKFLNRYPEEYLAYFQWKKHYVIDTGFQNTVCTLCEKLHKPIETKVYDDILSWYGGNKLSECKVGDALPNIVKNIK